MFGLPDPGRQARMGISLNLPQSPMIAFRPCAIALLFLLLGACDSADRPVKPVKPTAPSVPAAQPETPVQAPPRVSEPLAEPEAVFKPELQLPKPPEPEPRVQAEPLEPVVQTPPPALKKPAVAKPQVVRSTRKPPPVEKAPEPQVPLDLSLPEELLETLQPLETPMEMDSTLLPPMFREEPEENPFQLNGRLITKERQDEIEGAELQIQFKR